LSEVIRQNDSAESPKTQLWPIVAGIIVLFGITFWWTARWMVVRWDRSNSYYSHGWLILPISAFLVYLRRKEIAACGRRPSWAGLALFLPSLLVHLLGAAWQVGFLSGFALLGTVAGLVLTMLGAEVFRVVLFPLVFLVFLVPLPEVLVETVSFRLKFLAARTSTGVLEIFRLPAIREGSYIRIPTGALIVGDVCSGLKYLISLTAFGALYAYISPLNKFRKGLLFGLAIPIAFLANVVRVTLMVLVAFCFGIAAVDRWYFHDFFGIFLFIVAFTLLFAAESMLLGNARLRRWTSGGEQDDALEANHASSAHPRPALKPPTSSAGVLSLAVLSSLLLSAVLSTYLAWPRPERDPSQLLGRIPQTLSEWDGVDLELTDREYELLGTRDVLARVYSSARQDRQIQMVIVLAQQLRRRTHPPEQCLTGEGYAIRNSAERSVRLGTEDSGTELRVRELILDRGDRRRVAWYFYKSGSRIHTSYWLHQVGVAARKLTNRNASDILVRIETTVRGSELEEARKSLGELLSDAMPAIMEHLP